MEITRPFKNALKKTAERFGYTITRKDGGSTEIRGYVGDETIAAASNAGLPVWEYYDTIWEPACSFENLVRLYLAPRMGRGLRVLEIGTGVGRLAARILQQLDVAQFLSFEPSPVLRKCLRESFPGRITEMPVHGHSLDGVSNGCVDLVAAAGVFTYLPTSTIFNYLDEAVRVLKPGGILFFDVLDTDRYSPLLLDAVRSFARQHDDRPLLSSRFITSYLADLKLEALEPFPPPGTSAGTYGSQFLIFQKLQLGGGGGNRTRVRKP